MTLLRHDVLTGNDRVSLGSEQDLAGSIGSNRRSAVAWEKGSSRAQRQGQSNHGNSGSGQELHVVARKELRRMSVSTQFIVCLPRKSYTSTCSQQGQCEVAMVDLIVDADLLRVVGGNDSVRH
jgi:hypothetical protein